MKSLRNSFGTRLMAVGLMAALMLGAAPLTHAQAAAFTADLTVGSSGAQVTALQTFLISKGYAIPSGATGYFGAQTRAAVAAFQAAQGIVPPAGYFGPLTRAKANAAVTGTPPTSGTSSGNTSSLKGGEADLSGYELSGERSNGSEGEEMVEAATASFDVEDGDVRVERLELRVAANDLAKNSQPWKYFKRAYVLADGKELADLDTDSRSDWSRDGNDAYRITFTNLNHVVREGKEAELTVAFDIAGTIDSTDLSQEFALSIGDRGIRATDSEGIQQYTGKASDAVSFGFDAEENGDLKIRTNSDDPEASILISDDQNESDDYTVFVFDLENKSEVDTLVTELAIGVTSGLDADDVIRSATLTVGKKEYRGTIAADSITFKKMKLAVDGDDTETATLEVRLARNAPSTTLAFDIDATADLEAEGVVSGDDATLSGIARSETHTVATTGVRVASGSNSASSNKNETSGTFSLTFDVTALEDDLYIYRGAGLGDDDATPFSEMASTTGFALTAYQGGTASTSIDGVSTLVQSGADTVGEYFVIREGKKASFTITATLTPTGAPTGLYYLELDAIRFDDETLSGTADDTLYFVPDTRQFETKAIVLSGS